MNKYENQKIKEALSSCLSGVEALPSQRADILRAAKGEVKVKRKMNLGLVLALILVLLTTSVAVAEALGLFGQIGQREDSDARLPGLDTASTPVEQVFTTPEGVTVTINQAYYDGTRVFVSYTVAGPHQVVEQGEGKPEHVVNYDFELPGTLYGEKYRWDMTPADKQIAAYLDGSAPRWAKKTSVTVSDNMEMAEGTNMNIIGGGGIDIYQADGSYINWKECEVPADKAAEEITVILRVFTSETTYYQTADCLYQSYGGVTGRNKFAFTVKKDTDVTKLTGSAKAAEYTAEAALTASAIDLKGEIAIECPQSWVDAWTTWENPDKVDYIREWVLYIGGEKVEGYNLDGSIDANTAGMLRFGICYKLDGVSEDMKLVPVYGYAGEKVEEAIVLAPIK